MTNAKFFRAQINAREESTARAVARLGALQKKYRCITGVGKDRRHFVESTFGPLSWWIVPGTDPEDPDYEKGYAMLAYARSHATHYWLGDYPKQ